MGISVKQKIKIISPKLNSGCGVADYTNELVNNLLKIGLDAEIIYVNDWGLSNVRLLLKKISLKSNELLHIQYPSQPYGKSLIINLIGIIYFKKFVLTLHEYSQVHFMRKMSGLILCFCSNQIIFTNQADMNVITEKWAFLKKKSGLIGIGSNIPVLSKTPCLNIGFNVVFFGLIRPNKGVEEFLQLASISSNSDLKLNFIIIGSKQKGNGIYFEEILSQVKNLNIEIYLDQEPNHVAEILMSANFAYLHYPDGVSERRGSFLAALGNNLIVLSNKGRYTSLSLSKTYIDCQTPNKAFLTIQQLVNNKSLIGLSNKDINDYLQGRNWDTIAKIHKSLYLKLLASEDTKNRKLIYRL